MTWITIWFIVYLFEIFIWAYIFYLHYESKINQEKMKFPRKMNVVIRSKKDIVRG
jgi:hypothetical protein